MTFCSKQIFRVHVSAAAAASEQLPHNGRHREFTTFFRIITYLSVDLIVAWIALALAVTQLTQPSLKMSIAREERKALTDHSCFYLSFTASQIAFIVETTTCGGFPLSGKKREKKFSWKDFSAFTAYQCAMRCSMRWDEPQSCEQWKSETMDFSDLETIRTRIGIPFFVFSCECMTADWWIQFFFARI